MLLDCSYFPFLFALVSKNTGVRPEKCSKSRIFYIEASTKEFVTFLWHWQQTKNSNLMQIWAYICDCKACPRYVQDVSKMPSNHRNKRLVTLLGSYTKRQKYWYAASCSTNNDVSNTQVIHFVLFVLYKSQGRMTMWWCDAASIPCDDTCNGWEYGMATLRAVTVDNEGGRHGWWGHTKTTTDPHPP